MSLESRERVAATHAPKRSYADYDAMLADPNVDAVIIATAERIAWLHRV